MRTVFLSLSAARDLPYGLDRVVPCGLTLYGMYVCVVRGERIKFVQVN